MVHETPAQERVFRPEDAAPRAEAATALTAVLARAADLPTTVALAAGAGARLAEGSAAAAHLRGALQAANAAADPARALPQLRSDLGDLVEILTFRPLVQAEQPKDFPAFGAVDEIELRRYPAYRMARTAMANGSTAAFWPLFQHIQSNDIAMTTPVQMDWLDGTRRGRPSAMAFLYGDPATTPRSVARAVEVVDVPAQTVLSLGAIGEDSRERVESMAARLRARAEAAGSGLTIAGEIRTMGYNSPMVSRDRRYFEVQLPVAPRAL